MKIINTLSDAIDYINVLYEGDSTSPSDGDEDYEVWQKLLNIAISIWEREEGVLWKELFTTLSAATDGDKTIAASDWDYNCPTDFVFPVGYVRVVGNKTSVFSVVQPQDVQLLDSSKGNWCYFTGNSSTGFDLHFNPSVSLETGATIKYEYYKTASQVTSASSVFEMADPMFAVYYVLGELKKDEGDTSGFNIATQKLESMKVLNDMTGWYQNDTVDNPVQDGFNT